MHNFLDFEKPLLEIQTKIEELRHLKDDSVNIANELVSLQDDFDRKLKELQNATAMADIVASPVILGTLVIDNAQI